MVGIRDAELNIWPGVLALVRAVLATMRGRRPWCWGYRQYHAAIGRREKGQTGMPSLERCIGCGALVPAIDGPTHPYIGASPGCWQVYGEVLAREYGEYAYPPVHRLTVDAYAVQHPGNPGRRSSQSVAVHLMSLCLVLERGVEPAAATQAIRRHLSGRREFPWLSPPSTPGNITVLDVRDAPHLADHTA